MDDRDLFGLLYIIGSSDKLEGRKRIQKMVCLAKYNQSIGYPFSFEYTKYLYGPYSFDLKDVLNRLVDLGIIDENFDNHIYTYSLTSNGKNLFKNLKEKISKDDVEKLKALVGKYPLDRHLPTLVAESKTFFH